MTDLTLFVLACYGATNIIARGRVFNSVRPKHHFFSCMMCQGFWVGMAMVWIFSIAFGCERPNLCSMFVAGCVSSAASYALGAVFGDFGVNIALGKKNAPETNVCAAKAPPILRRTTKIRPKRERLD